MNKRDQITRGKASAIICVILIIAFIGAISLPGCSKEKKEQPYRATGPCEVYSRLPEDIAKPVKVNYGGKIKLLGITTNKMSPDKLKISYYWQLISDIGLYNVIFVHFTDVGNTPLFGNDHDFCQGKSFGELKDKFIKETFVVNIPQSAAGQPIDIKVGVYAPEIQSNNRLKIESAGGTPVDEENTRALVEKFTP